MVYEAMKRVMKKSQEHRHSVYLKNLYKNLMKDGISTTTVERLSQRLCRTISHRTRTMVKIVNRWKLQDINNKLRQTQYANTQTWRREKKILEEEGVLAEFNELWRREVTRYGNELKEKMSTKLEFLRNKYKKRHIQIPDEIDGIILKDHVLDAEYTSAPKKYGGIVLNEDEETVLSLPPKFAIHKKVREEECQAEIEKSLAK